MLTGLTLRAIPALFLALVGSAALAQENAPPLAMGSPAHGAELIAEKGCGACHMIPGITGANGLVGPSAHAHGQANFRGWTVAQYAAKSRGMGSGAATLRSRQRDAFDRS